LAGIANSFPNFFKAITKLGALVERAVLTATADPPSLKTLKAFLKATSSGLMAAQHYKYSRD